MLFKITNTDIYKYFNHPFAGIFSFSGYLIIDYPKFERAFKRNIMIYETVNLTLYFHGYNAENQGRDLMIFNDLFGF